MKKFKMTITKWLILMSIIAIIETASFGWNVNWKTASNAEKKCDIAIISTSIVGGAILGLRDSREKKE